MLPIYVVQFRIAQPCSDWF